METIREANFSFGEEWNEIECDIDQDLLVEGWTANALIFIINNILIYVVNKEFCLKIDY